MISKFAMRPNIGKLSAMQQYTTMIDLQLEPLETCSYVNDLQRQWRTSKPFECMPGPTKLQRLRGFLRGGEFHGLAFDEIIRMGRKRYGDIYMLPGLFGQHTNLITFNLDDHEKIYRTEGQYPMRPGTETISYHRLQRKDDFYDGDNLGGLTNGPQWARFRHAVNPVLMQPKKTGIFIDPLQRVNEDFIQRILKIRNPSTLEVPENFISEIHHLCMESVAAIVLDKDRGMVRNEPQAGEAFELMKNLDTFSKSFFDLGIKPSIYKYIKTPSYKRFMRAANSLTDACRKFVGQAVQRAQENEANSSETPSVLEKLVKIDRRVAEIMSIDMLIGSVGTTSSALSGILLCIATNPEEQEILRQEILMQIGKSDNFTMDNMQQLPYLRACIKEALRLYPVTFGNTRITGMDLSLSGYQIPKDTHVFLASNMLLREQRYFPHPEKFIPERWLRSRVVDELSLNNINPFIYVPFGHGARMCVGKRLVDLLLEITLANLVRHFRLEYNYPTDNAFKNYYVNRCVIPLKFKFTDFVYENIENKKGMSCG